MNFDTKLVSSRRDEMIAKGLWFDKNIMQSLKLAYEKLPNKVALVSYKSHENIEKKLHMKIYGR